VRRVSWLRAAVLGANDGIVSVSSLVMGVAAAHATSSTITLAGTAGLVAGALSMAAGEYVSVSSQRDAERADVARETRELAEFPKSELQELTLIYEERGLDPALAKQVATEMMERDALGAHLRDELGFSPGAMARPVQAATVSALSFALGATPPVVLMAVAAARVRVPLTVALGAIGGRLGGASAWRAAVRVVVGGGLAMALTAGIGRLVGTAV
jgi:vacuolar iron transporter family protein